MSFQSPQIARQQDHEAGSSPRPSRDEAAIRGVDSGRTFFKAWTLVAPTNPRAVLNPDAGAALLSALAPVRDAG